MWYHPLVPLSLNSGPKRKPRRTKHQVVICPGLGPDQVAPEERMQLAVVSKQGPLTLPSSQHDLAEPMMQRQRTRLAVMDLASSSLSLRTPLDVSCSRQGTCFPRGAAWLCALPSLSILYLIWPALSLLPVTCLKRRSWTHSHPFVLHSHCINCRPVCA